MDETYRYNKVKADIRTTKRSTLLKLFTDLRSF
jgi:hypothetical protein